MFPEVIPDLNSITHHINQDFGSSSQMIQNPISNHDQPPTKAKKNTNQPRIPDLDAEVIALSPESLMAQNRFVCEICSKGFPREQNLQFHRTTHDLQWKLKQTKSSKENKKRVYVCPEPSCVRHDPSRALCDLSGMKKHFCRKHGEKKWKCDKCTKTFAVRSDWKAHSKTCGKKEYKCLCGSSFRKDSFVTHKAFCKSLLQEYGGICTTHHITDSIPPPPPPSSLLPPNPNPNHSQLLFSHLNLQPPIPSSFAQFSAFNDRLVWNPTVSQNPNPNIIQAHQNLVKVKPEQLYQERIVMMVESSSFPTSVGPNTGHENPSESFTRNFLGLTEEQRGGRVGGLSGAASGFLSV